MNTRVIRNGLFVTVMLAAALVLPTGASLAQSCGPQCQACVMDYVAQYNQCMSNCRAQWHQYLYPWDDAWCYVNMGCGTFADQAQGCYYLGN